ncbi:hypothetical protein N7513_002013 [Penicillium frequentans]|nr:hypothetical protein N7513_002013 [Penicillium glabrum]
MPTEDDTMDSANTPFLSLEEKGEPSSDNDPHGRRLEQGPRALYVAFRIFLYLLAAWGSISLCYQALRLPFPHKGDFRLTDLNMCDCGATLQEALSRDCTYDSISATWLPPYCRDDDLNAEFDRAGPGVNGAWNYFLDENGTIPLTKDEISALSETKGSFWVSRKWHIAHCVFIWQKYHRISETGVVMEKRYDNLDHVKHCSRLILSPVPDYFFLMEVPVRINSSEPVESARLSITTMDHLKG